MSATLMDTLENAEINLENAKRIGPAMLPMAQQQLHHAIVLLQKGYSLDDEVDPLPEKYGSIENVPDKGDATPAQARKGE